MLGNADKLTYMEKLQGDYKIIQEKIEETIENVIVARNEAKESIAKGEETLANFRQYQKRVDNLVNKMCINMGYDDKKDRKRVTKLGQEEKAKRQQLIKNGCQGCQKAYTKSIHCQLCGSGTQKM